MSTRERPAGGLDGAGDDAARASALGGGAAGSHPPGMSADARTPSALASVMPPDAASLSLAARLLIQGELVAMPTETVYGLAADATQPSAVARIFAAKGRPNDHPVIVHVLPEADLSSWAACVPAAAKVLAARFWPGPLTMILPRAPGVSDALTGGQDTVGLRCPAHPVALALLRAFRDAGGSGAVAAPSANRFGRVSPTRAAHVADEFGPAVALILDGGQCPIGIESTILDLSRERPVLLRPGHLTSAALAETLGESVWLPDGTLAAAAPDATQTPAPAGMAPRVPGALAAHYAPRTRLQLVPADALAADVAQRQAHGERVAVWSAARPAGLPLAQWRARPTDAAGAAHALYAVLRELDAGGFDRILVEATPDDAAWDAVRDRLGRAVTGSGMPG